VIPAPDPSALRRELTAERGFLRRLRDRAAGRDLRLLLPEPHDPRVLTAARVILDLGLGRPLLVGRPPRTGRAAELARALPGDCWRDPEDGAGRREVAEHLHRRRRHRGLTQGEAHVLAADPVHHAASLLALDRADALVGGASVATGDLVRACLWAIGPAPGERTVSGAFLMTPAGGEGEPLVLSDCAVVPEPTGEQLLEIARAAGNLYRDLVGREPAVAMLSFSTRGSSRHPTAQRIAATADALAGLEPAWRVRGEIQVDAALVPEVAAQKGIDWGEGGQAGVLVFPDLASGNIGSKLVERLGGWRAVGPVLLGLRRPVCDLSRGCTARDVVDTAAVAALRCPGARAGGA
jgi:phosphate acetyltransferase